MSFERSSEHLQEQSLLLETENLSNAQRQALSRAVMQEEDDWLEWKASKEMLES